METPAFYSLAADTVLILHVVFVICVVLGLILIVAGGLLSWDWVKNPCFRIIHLLGIGIVVIQSWFGVVCPITTWEMSLRLKAGDSRYEGSFITHWLSELLYYDAPMWVFVVCYTVFGGAVLSSWFFVRPRAFSMSNRRGKS